MVSQVGFWLVLRCEAGRRSPPTWEDVEDPVETDAAIDVEECGDKPAAEWVEAPPLFTFGALYFHVWLIVFSLFPSPPPQARPRKHAISIVLSSEPHQ